MENKIICPCMEVSKNDIETAIKDKKLITAAEVGEVTGAGPVCGVCIDDIEDILKNLTY
jgi:bacterioferritin-associated ferredoxin